MEGVGASGGPGAAGGGDPRPGSGWAGLPEDLLVEVAETLVSQTAAGWEAWLRELGWDEREIQEEIAWRKHFSNCLFVFARVCKHWRKAQLKVGGPLRTRVKSDVILPGSVALAKWALAEGCPRTRGDGFGDTMAHVAARHGHWELLRWLCGEGASRWTRT